MELQTLYSDETAQVHVNQEDSYIGIRWLTHPESSTFRDIITRAHAYAHEHHLTKWLCNMEQAEFLELADQHWLVEEIFTAFNPQLQHDYAYIIRPLVAEVLTTYHIQDLVQVDEQLKEKVNVAVFMDIDQAYQWLFTSSNPVTLPPQP
ncbi:hypothetical protein AHMF7605_03290 [Adhaeribacter arboris]|uniref:STAS/SEC14 domain-containing protein n=1 Tax=Adhaeribacter arboris TaxID=2072846 RepID=A0A2T2YAV8_9BACT|nr:hypothetical protein [Adhaeribacter arboris]PSR52616.1 hypothetical protein AHMF7605_03290 [Adhaeribacter arboris]